MNSWQLQEAKAKFSKVIREATRHGPQDITVHGASTAVVISKADYEKLIKPKSTFVEFIQKSPLAGIELDIERDKSLNRDIEL